jgi:hypothetical protein
VALSRAAENRSDPTFDGMARGGAQRVLQQLAKDLEAAALFAECEIRLDESPVELVQVAEQAWSSTDGLLELRRKLIRQGTLIDLYVDGRQIKQFYMDAEIGYGLEGPESVHVFDITPEQAQTEVAGTTYGAILRAYVRAAEATYGNRPNTIDFNPRRANALADSKSP